MHNVKVTQRQIDQILALREQGLGARKIQDLVGLNRSTIQRIYVNLGLRNTRPPSILLMRKEYECKRCKCIKLLECFRKRERKGRISHEVYCIPCEAEYSKESNKERYLKNRTTRLRGAKVYREKEENKLRYREYSKIYSKKRRTADANYKLRQNLSVYIGNSLRRNGGRKSGSCIKSLNYKIAELRTHLELQFESWMSWANRGKYNAKTWNDNDSSTWTWQIDHIIPASTFKYTSMDDESFKNCWALANLRPYSAKQNIIDGNRRLMHKNL